MYTMQFLINVHVTGLRAIIIMSGKCLAYDHSHCSVHPFVPTCPL